MTVPYQYTDLPHFLITPRTRLGYNKYREAIARLLVCYYPHLQSWAVSASLNELEGVLEDVLNARSGQSPMELSSKPTFRCGELF